MTLRDLTAGQAHKLQLRGRTELRLFQKSPYLKQDVETAFLQAYSQGVKATLEIVCSSTPTPQSADSESKKVGASTAAHEASQSPDSDAPAGAAPVAKKADTLTSKPKAS